MSIPCSSASSTAPRFSFAAFSLPGTLTISVLPRMPAAPRLRQPRGVTRRLARRMASGMPGVRRSTTSSVASGVISRCEKPVPPVVTTRGMRSSSARRMSAAPIWSRSSGTTPVHASSKPACSSIAHRAGPLVSTRSPREHLSLTVSTAALYFMEKTSPISFSPSYTHPGLRARGLTGRRRVLYNETKTAKEMIACCRRTPFCC